MVLKNSKGKERNFNVILKIEKNHKVYIIYEDKYSNKIYAGIKEDNILKKLAEEDKHFINMVVERVVNR